MATGNQTTLFVLGLGSFVCGPATGIPGIVIGRKMADRGALGDLGYFLCWMFTILYGIAILIGFVAAITVPLWHK
jgi:hypothetical protein